MGSSDFSLPILKSLFENYQLKAVYTRKPKPKARGLKLQKTPVHLFAEENEIPVHTPKTLRDEQEQNILKDYNPDLIIVAAYGLILPKEVLDIPSKGCINVHASLLPRWRGAAPIQRCIMAGDTETGITIMGMEEGLDTGPIFMKEAFDIKKTDNFKIVHDKLAQLGAELIVKTLNSLGTITPQKQPEEGVTYADKIKKEEYIIDLTWPAHNVFNLIRALNPARLNFQDQILLIHEAHLTDEKSQNPGTIRIEKNRFLLECQDEILEVTKIQKPGKRILTTGEFLRGFRLN